MEQQNVMPEGSEKAEESLKIHLNEVLKGRFLRATEYQTVQVLLLYWDESDDAGFQTEAYDMGRVFEHGFRYTVNYFAIPTASPQLLLSHRITELLIGNRDSHTLLIIHYGGHADEDRLGPESCRQAVWTS